MDGAAYTFAPDLRRNRELALYHVSGVVATATFTEPRESDSAASGIYGVLRAPHFAVAAIYETAHGLRSGPQSRGQLIEDACLSNKKASAHRSQRRAIRQGISARHCAGPDREA